MKLEINRKELEGIVLAWAEKEMPGKFNTVSFKSYGNEVELTFSQPKDDKNE